MIIHKGTTGHPFAVLSNHYNFDIKWNLYQDINGWKKAIINKVNDFINIISI